MLKQFPSPHELKDKIKFSISLKSIFESNKEGMICFLQNSFFSKSMLQLVCFNDLILIQNFDGIILLIILFLSHDNFAECSFTQHFNKVKILNTNITFFIFPSKKHGCLFPHFSSSNISLFSIIFIRIKINNFHFRFRWAY